MAGETRAAVQRIEAQLTALATIPERVTALESWRKRTVAAVALVATTVGFGLKLMFTKIFS